METSSDSDSSYPDVMAMILAKMAADGVDINDIGYVVMEGPNNKPSIKMKRLHRQRKTQGDAFLKIQGANKTIRAHKSVLGAASTVLKAKVDNTDHPSQKILIETCEFQNTDVIEGLIDFMYTGRLFVPKEEIHTAIEYAVNLQIEGVAGLLLQGMLTLFRDGLGIVCVAKKLAKMIGDVDSNVGPFLQVTNSVMESRFHDGIIDHEMTLSVMDEAFMFDLFNSNVIKYCHKSQLIDFIKRWLDADPRQHIKYAPKLINIVIPWMLSDEHKDKMKSLTNDQVEDEKQKEIIKEVFDELQSKMEKIEWGKIDEVQEPREYLIVPLQIPRCLLVYSPVTDCWYTLGLSSMRRAVCEEVNKFFVTIRDGAILCNRRTGAERWERGIKMGVGEITSVDMDSLKVDTYAELYDGRSMYRDEQSLRFVVQCNGKLYSLQMDDPGRRTTAFLKKRPNTKKLRLKALDDTTKGWADCHVFKGYKWPYMWSNGITWRIVDNRWIYIGIHSRKHDIENQNGERKKLGGQLFFDLYRYDTVEGASELLASTSDMVGKKIAQRFQYKLLGEHDGKLMMIRIIKEKNAIRRSNPTEEVYGFNLQSKEWSQLPPLKEPVSEKITSLPVIRSKENWNMICMSQRECKSYCMFTSGDLELVTDFFLMDQFTGEIKQLAPFPNSTHSTDTRAHTVFMKPGFIEKLPRSKFYQSQPTIGMISLPDEYSNPPIFDNFKGFVGTAPSTINKKTAFGPNADIDWYLVPARIMRRDKWTSQCRADLDPSFQYHCDSDDDCCEFDDDDNSNRHHFSDLDEESDGSDDRDKDSDEGNTDIVDDKLFEDELSESDDEEDEDDTAKSKNNSCDPSFSDSDDGGQCRGSKRASDDPVELQSKRKEALCDDSNDD